MVSRCKAANHRLLQLNVRIIRLSRGAIERATWTELERLQNACGGRLALFVDATSSGGGDRGPLAFVVCALLSVGCQLEQERFVDILPFLSAYQNRACGCWSSEVRRAADGSHAANAACSRKSSSSTSRSRSSSHSTANLARLSSPSTPPENGFLAALMLIVCAFLRRSLALRSDIRFLPSKFLGI